MIKNQRDFWSGIMFLVVGISFAWGATTYSFGTSARPGAGYFPFGLGVLLAMLGAIELFKALTFASEDGGAVGRIAWRPLIIIVAAIAIFGFVLPRLGMIISLPLLVIIVSLAGDEFRWHEAIFNSVALTAFSWFIFIWGLNLVIPLWPSFALR
jgi:hypothetical protein